MQNYTHFEICYRLFAKIATIKAILVQFLSQMLLSQLTSYHFIRTFEADGVKYYVAFLTRGVI